MSQDDSSIKSSVSGDDARNVTDKQGTLQSAQNDAFSLPLFNLI